MGSCVLTGICSALAGGGVPSSAPGELLGTLSAAPGTPAAAGQTHAMEEQPFTPDRLLGLCLC